MDLGLLRQQVDDGGSAGSFQALAVVGMVLSVAINLSKPNKKYGESLAIFFLVKGKTEWLLSCCWGCEC